MQRSCRWCRNSKNMCIIACMRTCTFSLLRTLQVQCICVLFNETRHLSCFSRFVGDDVGFGLGSTRFQRICTCTFLSWERGLWEGMRIYRDSAQCCMPLTVYLRWIYGSVKGAYTERVFLPLAQFRLHVSKKTTVPSNSMYSILQFKLYFDGFWMQVGLDRRKL